MNKEDIDETMIAKRDNFGMIIYLLLAILIVVAFAALRTIKSEGGECLLNPVPAFVDYMEKATASNVSCTCGFSNPKIPPMFVTNKGVKTLD